MVAIFCALHSQNSRRPRARQPVNRRWIATHGCARLGWLCLSNQASRRSDRLFLPGESFDVLAWLNHGTRRRWLSLSGRARGARRNVEAWKGIGRDKLFRGRGVDRDSQHRLESAWVAIRSCFMFLRFAYRSGYSVTCIFSVTATGISTAKMSILRAWRKNLARHSTFTARGQFWITTPDWMRRSRRSIT